MCLLEVGGIVSCIDPLALAWLSYEPRQLSSSVQTETAMVDVTLAVSTSPLRNQSYGNTVAYMAPYK